jgi:uncharacterized protein (DUF58 family)
MSTTLNDTLSSAGKTAENFPGLLLKAEAVAQSLMAGVHGRRRVGIGESFWQFRPYQSGDARRDIDWKQSAKRNDTFIRQTEWEASQTLWLYRDASESMNFSSSKKLLPKKFYAEVLLLALSMLALSGGEQVGLLGTALSPQRGYPSVQKIYETIPQQTHLTLSGRLIMPHSRLVVMSDFYFPPDTIRSFCESLAVRKIKGDFIQIIDPAERTLPYTGRVKFQDIEDDHASPIIIANVESVRSAYEEKFLRHQQDIAEMGRDFGWGFKSFATDMPPEAALADIYNGLSAHV